MGADRVAEIPEPDLSRQWRQDRRADRDAHDAERQLVETVGVIERGERSRRQKTRDDGVGEQRELHPRRADDRRPQGDEKSLHVGVPARPPEFGDDVAQRHVAGDQQHFEAPGDQHAPGGRVARGREECGERQCRQHDQVEQDRRGRRRSEATQRVENAAVERHQGHQQQIRKGDSSELDREREAHRVLVEPRRQHADHVGRKGEREGKECELAREQEREDAVGEEPRVLRPALLANPGIGRHEGGVERAFGEDGAKVIRQPEGDEERVGDRAGSQHRRHQHVAEEAGQAREQRESAHRQDAVDHAYIRCCTGRSHRRASDSQSSRCPYPASARRTASTMRS